MLLSGTGITKTGRDIPLAMEPLYALLAVPHVDKQKMEELVVRSGRRWVLIRPSFMVDVKQRGLEAVRVGVEIPGEKVHKRVIGYVVARADVGGWIFKECVKGDGGKWEGKMVSLTY